MRQRGLSAVAAGLLAAGLVGCAQNDAGSASGRQLVSVSVRLIQEGGPSAAPPQRPVANGWIQARSGGVARSTVRTDSRGLASIELAPGTYTFVGRETEDAGYYCHARHPIRLSSGTEQQVTVACIVP